MNDEKNESDNLATNAQSFGVCRNSCLPTQAHPNVSLASPGFPELRAGMEVRQKDEVEGPTVEEARGTGIFVTSDFSIWIPEPYL
jgi:DsbC/DsbD-like thiol-disulfide interchange protein